MNFSSFVALRYMTNRSNRFFSWISILSIVGITIGVAAMIVVLSVINGFEAELRNCFLAANAHIMAYRFPAGIKNYELWEETIKRDFGDVISGTSPFVHMDTMGRSDHLIHSVLVKGYVPRSRESVQSLGDIVRPREALQKLQDEVDAVGKGEALPAAPSIIVGARLADDLNLKVGSTFELISPQGDDDVNFQEMKSFRVAGIYDSGLQHYDKQIGILSLPAAQALFGMGPTVTGIEIGLKDPNESPKIASNMSKKYRITIKEWQSFNRGIFDAMRNERNVIGLIVALVASVASFNILTTLFVSVTQKQRDISISKSLGANNQQVLMVFLKQSLLIGATGSVAGSVLALILGKVIEHFRIIDLPDIYLLAKLPVNYDPSVYGLIGLASLLIAALAGLYPAWSATRVAPTQGLTERHRGE